MSDQKKTPLFSFVVPVYEAQKTLAVCVQSLQNQTFSDFEIILVDDGATDESPAMCDAFARQDARVRVLHRENGGATAARKTGAAFARGRYICCVDSDDLVATDYLEKMASVAGEKVDMICCGAFVGTAGRFREMPLRERPGYYSRQDMEKEIFPRLLQTAQADYFAPAYWGKAIERNLFCRQIGRLDEKIRIGEDGACVICCIYEAGGMTLLADCLYYYCDNPDSLTKGGKAFPWDGPARIARHLEENLDLEEFDFRQQWYRKITHELFTVVRSQFCRNDAYGVIAADIRNNLNHPLYRQAVGKSRFTGAAGKMARLALKYRWIGLIRLFHIYRRRKEK